MWDLSLHRVAAESAARWLSPGGLVAIDMLDLSSQKVKVSVT